MTDFGYTRDIPATNDNPSNDQPSMLINNQSNNDIWDVDHIGFNLANGGYHDVIHLVTQIAGNPAAISGIEQVYSKLYTPNYTGAISDTQLFAETSIGGISQLTGDSALSDGWQYIGGCLVQWGIVTMTLSGGAGAGNVVFKDRGPSSQGIPFPNNCFVVIPSLLAAVNNSSSDNTLSIVNYTAGILKPPSKTGFSWLFNGNNSSNFTQFFWVAIGN